MADDIQVKNKAQNPSWGGKNNWPLVLVIGIDVSTQEKIFAALAGSYQLATADNAEEGLAKTFELRPDLILSELIMAEKQGEHLVAEVRAHEEFNDVPILILANPSDEQRCVQLLSEGAQDYIEKPFKAAVIKARVDSLVILKKTRVELEAKNMALALANRELEAFSYSVSHDLRSPLQSIIGFTTLLLDDHSLDAEGSDYLNEVLHAALNMKELIEDLLNFSRSTQSEIKYEIVDLSGMVKGIVKKLKARFPRKIKMVIKDQLITQCDAHLMQIALENLLANAWKYTSKTAEAQIEFGVINNKNPIYYLRDNGVGFPPEKIDRLFLPFSRLHPEKDFPGTGIGLATVRRIIERHGGRIWAESDGEKGATFYFTFPGNLAYC